MSKQTRERIWRKREHCIHYTSHCSVSTSTFSFLSQFAQEMAVEACEIRILHKILIKISIFQLWCIFVRVYLLFAWTSTRG